MAELAASRPTRLRRSTPIGLPSDAVRRRADYLVTPSGELRMAPLLAAMSLELDPTASTETRRHTGLDIVCVVLGGALRYEPAGAPGVTLGTEDVAVLSTRAGVDYRWRSVSKEPALAVMFWLLGTTGGAPRIDVRIARRVERLREAVPIAGRDTWLPTSRDVRILAGVVPVGGTLVHHVRGRRCYVMSTIGKITADGIAAGAGDGVMIDRTGAVRVAARESTEIVIIETP